MQHILPSFEILAISAVEPRKLDIYQRLLLVHKENLGLITAPTYQGKMGHQLLFSNGMQCLRRAAPKHLQNIREEILGLRQILK